MLLYGILIAFSILVLTVNTQPAIACSGLAMEVLEQHVGCVQSWWLCLCMCICVCVYVFMYVCIYVCVYVCVCVCIHVCVYLYICMCVYMYICNIYVYAPCSGVTVAEFGQLNACWISVMLMTRFF